MDFDFNTLLKKNECQSNRRAEIKSARIPTVASGTTKRRESQLKARKSNRLSIFDRIRNLPPTPRPVKTAPTESKVEHRRKQLERWKLEKEEKKIQEATNKVKPFLAGASRYVAPVAKSSNTTSTATGGRVTRSQARSKQSFAPPMATFEPPKSLKMASKYKLQIRTGRKTATYNNTSYKFNPIIANSKQTTNDVTRQIVSESRTRQVTQPVNRVTKASTLTEPKTTRNTVTLAKSSSSNQGQIAELTKKFTLTSSSSTESEPTVTKKGNTNKKLPQIKTSAQPLVSNKRTKAIATHSLGSLKKNEKTITLTHSSTSSSSDCEPPVTKRILRSTNTNSNNIAKNIPPQTQTKVSAEQHKSNKTTKAIATQASSMQNLKSKLTVTRSPSSEVEPPPTRRSQGYKKTNQTIKKMDETKASGIENRITKDIATQASSSKSNQTMPKLTVTRQSLSSSPELPPPPRRSLRSSSTNCKLQTAITGPSKIKQRVQTPRHIKLPEKNEPNRKSLKDITPKTIVYSNSSESSSDSNSSCDKVDKRRRSLRNAHTTSSDSTPIDENAPPTNVNGSEISMNSSTDPEDDKSVKLELQISAVPTPAKILPVVKPSRTPRRFPKSESSSEEKLRSPISPISDPTVTSSITPVKSGISLCGAYQPTPEQVQLKISPTITLSRGKAKARDETKWKLSEGLLDEDTCQMASVDHFRKQHASEVGHIMAKCNEWELISQQNLPEFVQELILSAVGHGRLLVSQKMQQFASLIERCAKPEFGVTPVTPADLQGFWDMVFMQVENIYIKFKNLDMLRDRNWIEEVPVKTKIAPKMAAKPPPRPDHVKKPLPSTTLSLREMIAANRRAMKEQQSQPSPVKTLTMLDDDTTDPRPFIVRSPVRSPVRTPVAHQATLLKAVLSSEAKKAQNESGKRNSASFAMLRAARMCRGVGCEVVDILPQTPLPEMNMDATPGRSILKSSTKAAPRRRSARKSAKVLFTDVEDTPAW